MQDMLITQHPEQQTFAGINGSNLLNIASNFGSTKANSPIIETTQ